MAIGVYQTLRASALDAPPRLENPPREKRETAISTGDCVPDLNCCFCAESVVDCGPGALGAYDASACHFGVCDLLGCFACS